MSMNSLIKLSRPKHYLKNLLVFAPLGLSLDYSDNAILKVIFGFLAFSLTASFGYIVNDILDVETDRQHHSKKFRPIASGEVSIKKALVLAIVLITLGLWLGFSVSDEFGLILVTYFILNNLYSSYFKTVKWLDVALLTSFFIMRLYAGSFAANVLISNWLILTSIVLFLMMSIDKRYNELFHSINARRAYKGHDIQILLTYRSSLLITVLVCINLYMNDLNASGLMRVMVTLISFVQLTTLMDNQEEDQVAKILNGKFLTLTILLGVLYVAMKMNIL
jgi:decaprenyl-phosphate phosphoribosyltransferase